MYAPTYEADLSLASVRRVFASPPTRETAPLIFEGREIRKTLLRGGSLRPEPATPRPVRSLPNAARFECDTAGFHAHAIEMIARVGLTAAKALSDNANLDPRLCAALRTVLSLPPSTRAQVIAHGRKRAAKFATGTHKLIPIGPEFEGKSRE